MKKTLVNKKYILEKFPGKGGWTYARIPEVLQSKKTPFGWVKVKGSIDDYVFNNSRLMPMGNGQLFLPLKSEVRRIIRKEAGDWIHVTLYEDNDPIIIPVEFIDCLKEVPNAYNQFSALKEGAQKSYLSWIYAAKKEQTKIARIVKSIEKIMKGMQFGDS